MVKKSIGTKHRYKLAKVIKTSKGIITSLEASKSLKVSRQEAGRILSRWNANGWLKRIKSGVYVPIAVENPDGDLAIEEPWLVISRIYNPGYIGGFSAIKHWDFSEQIFETVTFFTTKVVSERSPIIKGIRVRLKTIHLKKNFGTKTIWINNVKVFVSDPSKTIVDLLDDPSIAGGMRIVQDIFKEYLNSEYCNLTLLVTYAEKMGNRTILKRLGFLMETMGLIKEVSSLCILNKLSKGYSNFDPLAKNNVIVWRWQLKVPRVWKSEYDRKR